MFFTTSPLFLSASAMCLLFLHMKCIGRVLKMRRKIPPVGQVAPLFGRIGEKGAERSPLKWRIQPTGGPYGAPSYGEIGEQGGFHEPPHLAELGERGPSRAPSCGKIGGQGGCHEPPHSAKPGERGATVSSKDPPGRGKTHGPQKPDGEIRSSGAMHEPKGFSSTFISQRCGKPLRARWGGSFRAGCF